MVIGGCPHVIYLEILCDSLRDRAKPGDSNVLGLQRIIKGEIILNSADVSDDVPGGSHSEWFLKVLAFGKASSYN